MVHADRYQLIHNSLEPFIGLVLAHGLNVWQSDLRKELAKFRSFQKGSTQLNDKLTFFPYIGPLYYFVPEREWVLYSLLSSILKINSPKCAKVIKGNGNHIPYLFGFSQSLPAWIYLFDTWYDKCCPNPPFQQTSCVSSSFSYSLELIDFDDTPAALDMVPNPHAMVAVFMRWTWHSNLYNWI